MDLKQIAKNALLTFSVALVASLLSFYIIWYFNDITIGTLGFKSMTGLFAIAVCCGLANLIMYSKTPLNHRQTFLRYCIAIFASILAIFFVSYYIGWLHRFDEPFLMGFSIMLFTLVGVALVFYLKKQLKNHELKVRLQAQEKDYYYFQCQLMQESIHQVKSLKHDMKLHLSALKNMSAKAQGGEISHYLSELLEEIDAEEIYADTGNIAFDSIINCKLSQNDTDTIKLTMHLSIPPNLDIAPLDTVTILGNLLDNALTALAKVEDKVLKLNIEFQKGVLFIRLENTFDGVVRYDSKKTILSRKENNFAEHGWGLKSVERSVKKYNGHIDINHCENTFSVELILYLDD